MKKLSKAEQKRQWRLWEYRHGPRCKRFAELVQSAFPDLSSDVMIVIHEEAL